MLYELNNWARYSFNNIRIFHTEFSTDVTPLAVREQELVQSNNKLINNLLNYYKIPSCFNLMFFVLFVVSSLLGSFWSFEKYLNNFIMLPNNAIIYSSVFSSISFSLTQLLLLFWTVKFKLYGFKEYIL